MYTRRPWSEVSMFVTINAPASVLPVD